MEHIVGTVVVGLLTLGPLLWLNWTDRRADEALGVHARIQAAIRRRFRGEPMLSVNVQPSRPWRPGRVVLTTPAGWEWLIESAWSALVREVPEGYELVVTPRAARAARPAAMTPAVRHA